jgi:hypothetical protein
LSGRLLGDLFQPVDAAELHLAAVAAELVDRAGKPLAGLALPGQLLGGDGLQGGGAQVALELDPGVGHL